MRFRFSLSISCSLSLVLAACGGGDDGHDHDHGTPDAAEPAPDAGPQAVSIAFSARVNGAAFACGTSYAGVGSTDADYVGADFRFYVHDLALVPAGGGDPVPVALDSGPFQDGAAGLALLDFEDATAQCQTGSAATHAAVTGTVPPGDYAGLQFKVGVPFELNHLSTTEATPPLDATGMFWAWRTGYKFVKADGVVAGAGFNLHVGSTGCISDTPETPPDEACSAPNVIDVVLDGFDPDADTVVADVGAVLDAVDVTTNTVDTAPGCMSFPGDPECEPIFPRLGLPYAAVPAGTQVFFGME